MLRKIKAFFGLLRWDSVFTKIVLSMAIPIFFQSLVSQSLNLIDNLMVSHLGDAAYAGIAQATRYSLVANVMLFGVSSGTSIFVAQYWGAKQISDMKKSNGLGMTVGLGIGLTVMILTLFGAEAIISLFLAPGQSADYGAQYLRTIAFTFPLAAVTNSYALLLRCEEKSKYPMIAGMIAVLCNTLLNYLLIEGRFGFPRLGVVGAGIATVISAALCMLVLMYFGMRKSQSGRASLRELLGFDLSFVRKYIKTASPVMLNETFWSIGVALFSVFYGMRGDQSVAALGVFYSIDSIVLFSIYALTGTTGVVVGKALGTKDNELAMLYARRMMAGSLTLSMLMGTLVLLFVNPILAVFGKLSDETLHIAKLLVILNAALVWTRSFNSTVIVGILRAGGDTVASMILDLVFLWGFALPLVGLAATLTDWPIHLLYLLSLSDAVLKFLFGMRRFYSRKWIRNLTEA